MHRLVLKTFNFFKNCMQFVQIVMLFSILMLLLYWIQNITNAQWSWLTFYVPFLESFVKMGEMVSKASIDLFGAVFEFKYFIAVLFYVLIYYIAHFGICAIAFFEELYGDGRRTYNKMVENNFNDAIDAKITVEEKRLKRYQIYVSAELKKKFKHKELNIDLEEQLKIMNKFLIEKTEVSPEVYEGGFLYTFENFEKVDQILEIFFKVIHSTAPLDYVICVQILGEDITRETNQLKRLIGLHFANKISTLADTVWRYKYNKFHRYGTSQLGVFQAGKDTIEAHEFHEI